MVALGIPVSQKQGLVCLQFVATNREIHDNILSNQPLKERSGRLTGMVYVIIRPQGNCGACDVPEVLGGEAE